MFDKKFLAGIMVGGKKTDGIRREITFIKQFDEFLSDQGLSTDDSDVKLSHLFILPDRGLAPARWLNRAV